MAGHYGIDFGVFDEIEKNQREWARQVILPKIPSIAETLVANHVSVLESIGPSIAKRYADHFSPVYEQWAKSMSESIASHLVGYAGVHEAWKSLITYDRLATIAETIPDEEAEAKWEAVSEEDDEIVSIVEAAYGRTFDESSLVDTSGSLAAFTPHQLRWAGYVSVVLTFSFALYIVGVALPPDVFDALNTFLAVYGLAPKPSTDAEDG